jgi:hypothetical protein
MTLIREADPDSLAPPGTSTAKLNAEASRFNREQQMF